MKNTWWGIKSSQREQVRLQNNPVILVFRSKLSRHGQIYTVFIMECVLTFGTLQSYSLWRNWGCIHDLAHARVFNWKLTVKIKMHLATIRQFNPSHIFLSLGKAKQAFGKLKK